MRLAGRDFLATIGKTEILPQDRDSEERISGNRSVKWIILKLPPDFKRFKLIEIQSAKGIVSIFAVDFSSLNGFDNVLGIKKGGFVIT